ncbi:alcohol dehydrogenase catalytic domain-containing protein [Virgibacillus halophilus]|uniref:Alcohol dehydrogenase catalytic domain-containing protein n=1 Tax=Tigheibacillus halophilus TaxID=361280 RepID=A0ABU5CCN9_9BACI|nr:alcohol dehydrogenase catalytic domain-containing protein [Virgibacillus halophilus]
MNDLKGDEQKMLGVHAKNPGGPEQLELIDVAVPKPRKGEILIKVHAAALNRTDIITREGKMSYLQNPILGVEVSGTVIDSNGTNFVKDEKVAGLVNGGGVCGICCNACRKSDEDTRLIYI